MSLSESDIEVAGEIVDSELDMSRLFPNSEIKQDQEEDNSKEIEDTEKSEEELTKEQAEIVSNIYSKEESDIHKKSEEESLEGYELSNIETVDEDYNFNDSFKRLILM